MNIHDVPLETYPRTNIIVRIIKLRIIYSYTIRKLQWIPLISHLSCTSVLWQYPRFDIKHMTPSLLTRSYENGLGFEHCEWSQEVWIIEVALKRELTVY